MAASARVSFQKILLKLQSVGYFSGPEIDPLPDNLATLFDRMVSVFFSEIHPVGPTIRPVPVIVGGDCHVDLFRLYFAVRDRGGFGLVTARNIWGSVAEAIGLDPGLAISVKMVYSKYLADLDRWLAGVVGAERKEIKEKETLFLSPVSRRRVVEMEVDPKLKLVACSSIKRKRDDMVGMLNWILRVANNPSDPSVEKLLMKNGEKDKTVREVREVFAQALATRQAMFIQKIGGLSLQKCQKAHPSIYEDHLNSGNMKIRSSERINSITKQSPSGPEEETDEDGPLSIEKRRKIPIGKYFQVYVPAWSGKPSATSYNSDDLSCLVTPVMPPRNQEESPALEQDCIGKGRKDNCRCKFQGSVECIRLHVVEARMKLKQELGSVFYSWKFDGMGEEVALKWTEHEAQKFKSIVRLHPPSLGRNLWKQLRLAFPLKEIKQLVNYYFNVFLLGRRSYQNRLTPNKVDSDDEDSEFSFISGSFGLDATMIHPPKLIVCAENKQCIDIDDDDDNLLN